ncbi:RelA/SpoT domain-containing protein, partial [Yersinia alsatica]|uniref:RelA/SpoT domain-containing protein n=1 Tax=Yersinia alsatica TaxID=2890317 RepID=UPI0016438761
MMSESIKVLNEKESLDDFLSRNRIDREQYNKASIEWDDLLKIGLEHQKNFSLLSDTAAFLAKVLQQGKGVHSVRWRVKDAEHLMEKIIRKKSDGSEKYKNITYENYSEKITDLVGVRVLHLFKEDWSLIHDYIMSKWSAHETPIAYIRSGD